MAEGAKGDISDGCTRRMSWLGEADAHVSVDDVEDFWVA